MATIEKRVARNSHVTWRARVRVLRQTCVTTFKHKTDPTEVIRSSTPVIRKGSGCAATVLAGVIMADTKNIQTLSVDD